MTSLEESTSKETWDAELRNTLRDQLIDFLNQSTSTEPEYLVRAYEQHLLQLITAQNQRLRAKYADDRKGMLKESGAVKRIISKIPDIARETLQTHVYNPDKRLRRDKVYDEQSLKRKDGRKRLNTTHPLKDQVQLLHRQRLRRQLSQSQRHHIEIQNRKSYHLKPKWQGELVFCDELEDHQLKQALARSVLDIQHDPSETPNAGGSAASSIPSEPVVVLHHL